MFASWYICNIYNTFFAVVPAVGVHLLPVIVDVAGKRTLKCTWAFLIKTQFFNRRQQQQRAPPRWTDRRETPAGASQKEPKLPLKYVELLLNKIWTDATNCGFYKLSKHLHNLPLFAYSTCIHYGQVATCSQINAGNSAKDGINHVTNKGRGESETLLQLFASQSEQLKQPSGQLLRVVYCEFVVSMQHNQRHHRQSAKQQQQQQLQQCCRCKCLSNCFNLRLFILCPAAATAADVDDDDDDEDEDDDDDDDDNKCTTLWPWRLVRLLDWVGYAEYLYLAIAFCPGGSYVPHGAELLARAMVNRYYARWSCTCSMRATKINKVRKRHRSSTPRPQATWLKTQTQVWQFSKLGWGIISILVLVGGAEFLLDISLPISFQLSIFSQNYCQTPSNPFINSSVSICEINCIPPEYSLS